MRYSIFVFVTFIFTACSSITPFVQDTKDKITINTNNTTVTVLTQGKQTYKTGGCLQNSFFFENEKHQIDYINLKTHCAWTGLADGYYQDFLRENIKGLVKKKSFKLNNGDIYQLGLHNRYFYLVSLYNATGNLFLIDYTGDVVSLILNKNLSIEKSSQMDERLKKSLLEAYQFKGYFESQRGEESNIIPVL